MNEAILTPIIQYGFAGLSAILLGIIIWLIKKLLEVFEKTNKTISRNSDIMEGIRKNGDERDWILTKLHDKLLERPCMIDRPK